MRRSRSCLNLFLIGFVIAAFVCSPFFTSTATAQGERPNDVPVQKQDIPLNQPNVPAVEPLNFVPMAPLPSFTPSNVNVSNLLGHESEVSIAVNPTDPQNMVICGHSPNLTPMNTFYTTDGGQTWTRVALGSAFDGQAAACDRVDPTVAFDDNGNVFVSYFTTRCGDGTRTLYVARSSDGGQTYQGPTEVADETDGEVDKEIIGCGPDPNNPAQQNVYLAYRLEVGSDVQLHLAASYDGGVTFPTDEIINDESIAGNDFATFGVPAVGPNGELYVVWDDESNWPASSEIMIDVSPDAGVTWGTDVSISTTAVTRGNTNRYDITAQPDRGILAVPCVDVDRSGGTYDGRVYVTYTVVGGGGFDDVDVVIQSSDDGAQTWTTPLVVNDDGGSGSQFLPWLAIDNCDDGTVTVGFLDTRNDANDQMVQCYLAVSEDGGASFEPNVQIAAGQSDQSTNNPLRTGNNYLEYIGIDACGGVVCLVWPDNSANSADMDFFSDCACLTDVVLTCPADIMVECTGSGGAPATNPAIQAFLNGVSGEGCGGNFTISNDAPAFFSLGTTTVTFSAVDLSGNTTTCMADVQVVDTTDPVITCPGDVTVECAGFCGTPRDDSQLAAFFAGVSASDACCDVTITDDAPDCFPLGTTTVKFTATDCAGNADSCTADVTVQDTTPPELTVRLNRNVLWPPNHKWVDIRAFVTVTDVCCPDPNWRLVDVRSNEPANGKGDGNTDVDIEIITRRHVRLRSERAGGGDGRVYTFIFRARDCSDNRTTVLRRVRVPHDHSGMAFASAGFAGDGIGFDNGVEQFALVLPSRPAQYEIDGNGNEVLVAEAFDATAIDLSEAYVGNLYDVILPIETLEIDNNADGLMDLALYYSAPAVNMLITESTPTYENEVDLDVDYGPIGFHYTSGDGVDFLVPNIFDLGEPVPLIPTIGIGRTSDGDGGTADERTPTATALGSAYPNPFNPTTTIPFNLTAPERVELRIYNARGELVRTLKDDVMPAGTHQAVWDGLDNSGSKVATGVYFVALRAGAYQATKKVVMIK